jgi:hypothetical protein
MLGEGGKEMEERLEMVEQRLGRGGGITEDIATADGGGEQSTCAVGEGGGEVKLIRGVTTSAPKPTCPT